MLRNYDDLYEDVSSDVDIIVEQQYFAAFKECLDATAAETGCPLVHQARYTNYSFVYGRARGPFVRVDVETEVRWRTFPVLSAGAVIEARRRHGGFYIPAPAHESVILFVAATWRNHLRERYRQRLIALGEEVGSGETLRSTFRACFGRVGRLMADAQMSLQTGAVDPVLWRVVKRSIVLNAFRNGANARGLLGYLVMDLGRYWRRLTKPAGISVVYVRSADTPDETAELFKCMEFVYPIQKLFKYYAKVPRSRRVGLGFVLRLRRLHTLFKGGMFTRHYQVADEADIPMVVTTISRYLYPSRAFFLAQMSGGKLLMGHAGTGLVTERLPGAERTRAHEEFVQFVTGVLTQEAKSGEGFIPGMRAGASGGHSRPATTDSPLRPSFIRPALIGVALALALIIGVVGSYRLNIQAHAIADDAVPGLSLSGAVNANLAQGFNRTLMLLLADRPEERQQLRNEIEQFSQKTTAYLETYRGQIFSDEDRRLFERFLRRRHDYQEIRSRTLALAEAQRTQALTLFETELVKAYEGYKEAGDELFNYNTQLGASRGQAMLTLSAKIEFIIGAAAVVVFLCGLAIGKFRERLRGFIAARCD